MRLLSLDNEGIVKLVEGYEKEAKAIKKEILKLIWFMRGSLSYEEGMLLGQTDRELIMKLVEDNLKTAKETRMPFF